MSDPFGAWPSAAPPPPPSAPRGGGGAGAVVAAVFVGLWAVGLTLFTQPLSWLAEQILFIAGVPFPGWVWPGLTVVNALLVAVAAAPLAWIPRSPAVRAAGRAWLLGAAALALFGIVRAIPILENEAYLASLAVLAALGAVALRRSRPAGEDPAPGAGYLAAAAGLLVLIPWLWVGAAGGLTETLLAAVAAAAVGWLAAAILNADFWAPFARPRADLGPVGAPAMIGPTGAAGAPVVGPVGASGGWPGSSAGSFTTGASGGPAGSGTGAEHVAGVDPDGPAGSGRPSRGRLVGLGGLVAGVALLLLGAGTGATGPHLATMVVLPSLGFAAAALRALGPRPRLPLLVGLAVFGPLAFVDPEEVTLLLLGRDVPFWALIATLGSLGGALLAGNAYNVVLPRGAAAPSRRTAVVAALAVGFAAVVVYAGPGQPGFHGDRLFVVLREQVDLSGIPAGTGQTGRDARATTVYQRLVAHAQRTQAGLRRDLDRLHLAYRPYYLVNAIEVDGGPAVRAWLEGRDDVNRVLLSQRLRPVPSPPEPERGTLAAPGTPGWDLQLIGADRVWNELKVTGQGITVGTSDSGVDGAHPALAAGFRGGDDSWYDPWNATRTPVDHGGHGTHTLGSAVGRTNTGVAPGASWVGCVNLDRNLGNPARYLDCLQFMLAPFPYGGDPFTAGRPARAPHVLTNSWGCPPLEGCDTDALRPATAAFAAAGIFFVAAAGNTGAWCGSIDDAPAPYEDVLTVGAVDQDRDVAPFSSRGPTDHGTVKPDVVAPGVAVLSALPGGGYGELDGTSMAAPHVAGVVALMWSANPALIGDVEATRRLLRSTATGTNADQSESRDCEGANSHGAGLVSADGAVRAATAGRPR